MKANLGDLSLGIISATNTMQKSMLVVFQVEEVYRKICADYKIGLLISLSSCIGNNFTIQNCLCHNSDKFSFQWKIFVEEYQESS